MLQCMMSVMSDLGPKWVRLAPNGTNSGLFQIRFQPKCTEILFEKVPDFSHTEPIWPSLSPNFSPLFSQPRTSKTVDLVWLNYRGKYVYYKRQMEPQGTLSMNTYVTHPWRAWFSDSEQRVHVGGSDTFMPQAWRGEQTRTVVYIDRPSKNFS